MKMDGTKIVYEVGDWITSVVKDDSYFTMGSVGQLGRYDGRDWWVYPSHTGNPDYPNMCVGKEYLFRPATQEEINKATEEEKIMWGQYEVNFKPAGHIDIKDVITIGCVTVTKELWDKTAERAGWK